MNECYMLIRKILFANGTVTFQSIRFYTSEEACRSAVGFHNREYEPLMGSPLLVDTPQGPRPGPTLSQVLGQLGIVGIEHGSVHGKMHEADIAAPAILM